jgi:hypothetical protein
MKYSDLLKEIENYDAKKGFWRRLFGDSPYIKILRDFLHQTSIAHKNCETLLNLDLKYCEYERFAEKTIPGLDILKHVKKHNTLSGMLLFQWMCKDSLASMSFEIPQINFPPSLSTSQILNHPRLVISQNQLPRVDISSINQPMHSLQEFITSALSTPRYWMLSDTLFQSTPGNSAWPQSHSHSTRERSFSGSSASFFVNEDGVVHTELATPPVSPVYLPVRPASLSPSYRNAAPAA